MTDIGNSDADCAALHQSIWDSIGARKSRFGDHVISEPAFVPAQEGYTDGKPGEDFPVLRFLDRALEIARKHEFKPIVNAFADIAGRLPWSQNPRYTADNGGLNLLNGYAYASLSGPEGPIRCLSPRGGFYLMGPNVLYPSHNHAPREVYLIMTPGVEWALDEGDWFPVQPGELIFHSPWQMHAMRSGDQPVLAYAAWLDPGNREAIGWSKEAGA